MTGLILERLNNEVLIFDGAMATMIQSLGCGSGESPEKWGIQNEAKLRRIHRGYIEAGADFITTDTFGGSSIKLAKYGKELKAKDINRKLAEIALDEANAAKSEIHVAGDIGPTGELIAPLGLLSKEEVYKSFAEQAEVLADGGVNLIIVETMMDPGEASIAIRAAKDVTGLPVFGSMTFNKTRNGFRTMMGTTPDQAVKQMMDAGADVVGANCGDVSISIMPDLIEQMKSAGAEKVIVMPNAGIPELRDGRTIFPMSPEEMASTTPALIKSGANIIGGCCGTTPDHIGLMAEAIENYQKTASI
jgi:5-methyltetrahydrofolate--homocysteine methyltransferase